MSRGPYKRRPRLIVDATKHQEGDVVQVGRKRWLIVTIRGQTVTLTATNADPAIHWHTTLDKLPTPIKEKP